MPLRTTFRREEQLVIVEGQGDVSMPDVVTCLRLIDAHGAHRYRKLADLRRVTTEVSEAIAGGLIDLARSRETLGAGGALAVVVDPVARLHELAKRVAEGAPPGRPIRIFTSIDEALSWIEGQRA
jgi:hypothetical protein